MTIWMIARRRLRSAASSWAEAPLHVDARRPPRSDVPPITVGFVAAAQHDREDAPGLGLHGLAQLGRDAVAEGRRPPSRCARRRSTYVPAAAARPR